MASPRHITAELVLDGTKLSGVITDHQDGRPRPFHGWLELIALLQPAGPPPSENQPRLLS